DVRNKIPQVRMDLSVLQTGRRIDKCDPINAMSVSALLLFQIFARISTCLMETKPHIAISTLLNVKGGLENHLQQ
ncbi:Uncharacterized protein DAT39_010806, partial [Clarias magur]